MNADEWQTCLDFEAMLNALPTVMATFRKLRLFACACARHFEDLIPEGVARRALAVAEQAADGVVPPREVSYHLVELDKKVGARINNDPVPRLISIGLQAKSSRAVALQLARSGAWYALSARAQVTHPEGLGDK